MAWRIPRHRWAVNVPWRRGVGLHSTQIIVRQSHVRACAAAWSHRQARVRGLQLAHAAWWRVLAARSVFPLRKSMALLASVLHNSAALRPCTPNTLCAKSTHANVNTRVPPGGVMILLDLW